jgi:energy-coupling factor transporter ATP-binding protein EcfA2
LELGFKGIPYLIDREGKRVFQHKMSSGEYMLIGLLDYIDSAQARLARTDEDSANTPPALILLDEIEIALHPAAQCRLATFLDYVADSLNMCVYFSTHSVQVLNVVHADNVYHLARAANGGIEVISPCGPAYATRDMYEPDGFDLIVLVEDILAKNIVEKVIRDGKLNRGKLIRVIPVGGWENTLQLHHELHISKAFGAGTKILSVLDGDVEDKCQAKCRNNPKLGYIKKAFLPIMSLEKYLLNKLVTSPDNMFSREMGDHFFTVRTLADIVSDYRGKTAKDNDGKILLSVLRACIEEQGVDREAFEKGLCSIITGREDHSALLNRLTGAFKSR